MQVLQTLDYAGRVEAGAVSVQPAAVTDQSEQISAEARLHQEVDVPVILQRAETPAVVIHNVRRNVTNK